MSNIIEPSKLFQDLANIGKRFYIIAIVYLIGIIGNFVPLLGSYLSLGANVLHFVLIFLLAMQIRDIYNQISTAELNSCYKFLAVGGILTLTSLIIGWFITDVVLEQMLVVMEQMEGMEDYAEMEAALQELISIMMPLLYIGVITIVGALFEFWAWRKLEIFWLQNIRIFPENIGYIAAKAIRNLKNAAFMTVISFLVITIFIGIILYLLGYFTLADALKKLEGNQVRYSSEPIIENPAYQYRDITHDNQINNPVQNAGFKPQLNFCPKCGTKLLPDAKFCPACGSTVSNL